MPLLVMTMMQLLKFYRYENTFARMRCFAIALLIPALLLLDLACGKKEAYVDSYESSSKSVNVGKPTNQTFFASLPKSLSLPKQTDEVEMRLLTDYGAMFVARGGVVPPPTIIFIDEAAVGTWQASVKTMRADFGGITVELQTPAMTALMEARSEAQKSSLDITPRGSDAARRSYSETLTLWQSRVNPGLSHWVTEGSLSEQEAARIRALAPLDQIPEILRLEKQGIYFSKDFSKSILYSVAAPGTSQHLSMLAFDVKEYDNPTVRSILARHGWFQTVSSDTPHFTFLGVTEDELPSLGLKKVKSEGRNFWVPKID
jgi:hypothetical protein